MFGRNVLFVFRGDHHLERKSCVGQWVEKAFFNIGSNKMSAFVNIYVTKESCMSGIQEEKLDAPTNISRLR